MAEATDKKTAARLQEQWLASRTRKALAPDEFARLYAAQFQALTDVLSWGER